MQYLTAYGALVREAGLQKHDFVLIMAASSSVGIAAIEITKNQGAIAIAATRTRAKTAQLLAIGADHVIVTNEEDLVARVKDTTRGRGARVIFDPIGGNG
jgi:NADPH:quinone reductase-like Zn-dependent oxidoreductase